MGRSAYLVRASCLGREVISLGKGRSSGSLGRSSSATVTPLDNLRMGGAAANRERPGFPLPRRNPGWGANPRGFIAASASR
jgi:hypothetical protein